jgi:hypothetical protein
MAETPHGGAVPTTKAFPVGAAPWEDRRHGERSPNDAIVYPDSGKVMARTARATFRQMATMEYRDGED